SFHPRGLLVEFPVFDEESRAAESLAFEGVAPITERLRGGENLAALPAGKGKKWIAKGPRLRMGQRWDARRANIQQGPPCNLATALPRTARSGGLCRRGQLQARMIQILRTSLLGLGSLTACVNWESAKPLTAMSIRTGTLAGRSFGWYSQPLNVLTLLTGV